MTAHTSDKPVVQPSETGWAKARRLRQKGVHTCLPAVENHGETHQEHTGAEWNIVRGED